jgi:hypothetical protein
MPSTTPNKPKVSPQEFTKTDYPADNNKSSKSHVMLNVDSHLFRAIFVPLVSVMLGNHRTPRVHLTCGFK